MDELSILKWQCRRGTKELDSLLNTYLENYYPFADQCQKSWFIELLKLEDDQLIDLLIKKAKTEETRILAEKLNRHDASLLSQWYLLIP